MACYCINSHPTFLLRIAYYNKESMETYYTILYRRFMLAFPTYNSYRVLLLCEPLATPFLMDKSSHSYENK